MLIDFADLVKVCSSITTSLISCRGAHLRFHRSPPETINTIQSLRISFSLCEHFVLTSNQINVFELGHVFKALSDIYSFSSHEIKTVIPEDLMYRFASKLDFGDLTNKVAEDAVRLCRRMGRDWMVMGRRPSGICGACLLMAARMWHFRRTVREIVYVVKVTTATVQERLGEFAVTESSSMSIEDFLNHEFLESRHDPPSYYKSSAEWQEKMEKEREASGRKRRRIEDIDEEPGENGSRASSKDMPPPPAPRPPPDTSKLPQVSQFLTKSFDKKEQREFIAPFDPKLLAAAAIPKASSIGRDVTDGMNAVQDPEADVVVDSLIQTYGGGSEGDEEDAVVELNSSRRRKKRRRDEDEGPFLTFDEQWEKDEDELEKQISEIITDPHTDKHRQALASAAFNAKVKAEWARSLLPQTHVNMDEIIGDDEFADDPEVQFCRLTDEEAKIKEMIWVNQNKDWLRKQQDKDFRKQMEELGPPKRRRNRYKKPRIGEGQLTPASTPQEAACAAMDRRGFSKRINYDAISNLFSSGGLGDRGPGSTAASLPGDESGRASRATSVASASTHKSAARSETKAAPSQLGKQAEPEPAASAEAEAGSEDEEEQEDEEAAPYDDEEVEHPGYDEDDYYNDEEEEFY